MSSQHSFNAREPRIVTIDADYIRPRLAASYLIIENGRAAFVETGTTKSVPRLLRALADAGLTAACRPPPVTDYQCRDDPGDDAQGIRTDRYRTQMPDAL